MDPPQSQPRGGSSGRNGGNSNSNSNGDGDGASRRLPKVDVYIPRHRRGANDDASNPPPPSESTDSRQSSTASSPRQANGPAAPRNALTTRSNSNYGREDGLEDTSSSSKSGNNSSSSDVQRRGRGKFMRPGTNGGGSGASKTNSGNGGIRGGRDRDYKGNGSNGNGSSRNNTNKSGYGSASTSSPSSQQPSPAAQAPPPAPRHPPRGRNFDATVLRRYSDDENRPNSSFSRSSSYTSPRSTNNNNQSSSTSTYSRSSGRTQDFNAAASRRPDRSDEGSWRREMPKPTETTTTIGTPGTTDGKDQESDLTAQFERVRLSTSASTSRSGSPDSTESTDEPEEWELALQNSDDDAIPAAPKDTRRHPAEHLLTSSSSTPSKIGNWSEISNDDIYILELYDFSASIKTAHLTDMFAAYENRSGGFRIKWVDETKALVIFESAAVAKQAHIANLTNQIAKIKPYNGPDKDSIRNAGKPSSGAYNGIRPAKTDSVARRLVQGALGLRVRRTPEQIAEEKAQIQAAKDAREAQRQEERRQREEEERQRQAMDAVFNS
ncbi:R3H and coiled-coil domain-containing protein 1 [Haplosporangium gracile]|nr:R3H and coiled-coil domain-containing protein 1 [Haplosporangium gracile]